MQNIVKVIENSYDNPYALHGLLKYIFTDKSSEDGRMCRFCGSYCTNIYSAEDEIMCLCRLRKLSIFSVSTFRKRSLDLKGQTNVL